jgi:serine/threonine-protein kinase
MVEPGRRNLPGPCGFLFARRAVTKECILVGFFESLLDRVERKTLIEHAGMFPRYLASGHLVYMTKGVLFAVPFDLDRVDERRGNAVNGSVK